MVFKDSHDVYNIWPRFWVSDKFEKKYKDKTPVQSWTPEHYTSCPGEVKLSDVEGEIIELIERFDIKVVGYDAMFAVQMAQDLEAATECEIAKYPQTLQAYALPTATFNQAIGNEEHRRIRHPAHPVLDWMAQHVEAEERDNMQKPTKPKDAPWLKVDGIQAMIMGIDCVHYVPEYDDGSEFAEPGSLFL